MADSQSRYGILDELNQRKIREKEKLSNLEQETDKSVFTQEGQIASLENSIKISEQNYEAEFQQWLRERQLALKMYTADVNREIARLEKEITDKQNSYKDEHKANIDAKTKEKTDLSKNLTRYQELQKAKIKSKTEIIAETEEGIKSIKEISQESKASE